MLDLIRSSCSGKDTTHKLPKYLNHLTGGILSFYKNFLILILPLVIFQIYRTNFISFIKLLQILVRTPAMIIVRPIIRRLGKKTELASYCIEKTILSTTTQIFFAHSKLTGIDICMKLWPTHEMGNSSFEDPTIQLKDLLEGFTFNRRFAPGVYLGLAPVAIHGEGTQKISRGDLIIKPNLNNLKPREYVIVMRNIQKEWKLDYRLRSKKDNLRTRKGMEFLAREVARMHKQLESSQPNKDHSDIIASKLTFNIGRLGQAVQLLRDADMEKKYLYICRVMNTACDKYAGYFNQRAYDGHIKRCHGDLKTANLWVSPRRLFPRKLFALDCIDFNSDFCHIDTLSDIAILAVDMQQLMAGSDKYDSGELIVHFLETYLKEMEEIDFRVQPLLGYYMTEKAMVCSYVNILFDRSPGLGKNFLFFAYLLAQQIEQLLVSAIPIPPSEQEIAILTNQMR